ncbi:hypothetical protein Btru_066857 [Bulinus truncatus]|nr:hypothetical protein Btru_066857 [Bulinus truncatus]
MNDSFIFLCVLQHCSEVIDETSLNSVLLSACDSGNRFIVLNILALNVDINCKDDIGNTPLMICAKNGYCDIARLLLINGANVQCVNENGDSPLILSVTKSGSRDMIELLFAQEGIDKYHKNHQGYTFLKKAVEMMDLDAMAVFCNAYRFKRECSQQDQNSLQEMFLEAQSFADEIGFKIYNYIFQNNAQLKSALVAAAVQSDLDAVKLLIHSDVIDKRWIQLMEGDIIYFIIKGYKERNTGVNEKDLDIIRTLITYNKYLYEFLLSDIVAIGSCTLLTFFCDLIDQTHPNNNQMFYHWGVEEALNQKRLDMLDILLKHKGTFWLQCKEKIDILDKAFKAGAINFIKMFFLLEDERNIYAGNCLFSSVRYGQEKCFDLTLEMFPSIVIDIVKNESSAILHKAAKNGNTNIINKLLELGADINGIHWDHTPLMFCRDAKTAKFLIQKGADVNFRTEIEKKSVMLNLPFNMMKMINPLNNYTKITVTEEMLEKIAKYKQLITLYQKCGINIDDTEKRGRTALMLAAEDRYGEYLVKILLECGADANKCDKIGRTALYFAVLRNRIKIVEILLQFESNVNVKFHDMKTCLHLSVTKSKRAIMRKLLAQGADVNAQDDDGNTPLKLAAGNSDFNFDVVQDLLRYGASVNIKNRHGCSALSNAVDSFRPKLIILLCSNGADGTLLDEGALSMISSVAYPRYGPDPENFILLLNYFLKRGARTAGVHLHNVAELIRHDNKPVSLEKLCLMTVWSVIGVHINQEETVETLPVPKAIKDKIMFRAVRISQDDDEQVLALKRTDMFDIDFVTNGTDTDLGDLNEDIEEPFEIFFRGNDDYLYDNL